MIKKLQILFLLAVIIGLNACSSGVRFSDNKHNGKKGTSSAKKDHPKSDQNDQQIDFSGLSEFQAAIVREAQSWIGTPYCYGGESRDCSDCSGFTMNVFVRSGISLPRTAADQYEFCVKTNSKHAMVGDLIFFGSKKKVNHVGIYVGNRMFVHASSSRGVVCESLDLDYYAKHFIGYGRVSGHLSCIDWLLLSPLCQERVSMQQQFSH